MKNKGKVSIFIICLLIIGFCFGSLAGYMARNVMADNEKERQKEIESQDNFKLLKIYGEDISSFSVCIRDNDREFFGTYSEENVPEEGYKATEQISLTDDLFVEKNDYLLDIEDLLQVLSYSDDLDMNKHMKIWSLDMTSHNFIVFYMKNGWEIWIFFEKGTVELHSGMTGYIAEFELDLVGEYKEMWKDKIVSYFFDKYRT